MKATINIVMDNAAFAEDAGGELARILRDIATVVAVGGVDADDTLILHDSNGNGVGTYKIEE